MSAELEDFSNLSVLLVEDENFAARLIIAALRSMNISNVTRLENGEEALKILARRTNFDLVISDWNMPKVTGIDLLRSVRHKLPKVKFMMLTGNVTEEAVMQAIKAGVDGYIAKPFSTEQLHAKVRSVLAKR